MHLTKTDEELMAAYQTGDRAAFDELFLRHGGRVLAYLRAKGVSVETAQDLLQETFLRLHRTRDRYDASLPFLPWLFTIAKNLLIDFQRRETRQRPSPMVEETVYPLTEKIELDLKGLNPEQRTAIEMRMIDDASFVDIARRLETTESNARQILSRGIRHLRKIWGRS